MCGEPFTIQHKTYIINYDYIFLSTLPAVFCFVSIFFICENHHSLIPWYNFLHLQISSLNPYFRVKTKCKTNKYFQKKQESYTVDRPVNKAQFAAEVIAEDKKQFYSGCRAGATTRPDFHDLVFTRPGLKSRNLKSNSAVSFKHVGVKTSRNTILSLQHCCEIGLRSTKLT
mgnify:CR=1 FL=1